MGWTIPYSTPHRKDLIAERVEDQTWTRKDGAKVERKALKHCYRGGVRSGVLYIVWETTTKQKNGSKSTERFIEVDLLRYYPEGRGEGNWGYKDMSCCMGPTSRSCPVSYLDMVPPHDGEWCGDWHKAVREGHAKRQQQRAKKKALKVGDTAKLLPGHKVKEVRIASLKPFEGYGEDGVLYRLSPSALA